MQNNTYDLLIIGGGAAGLTAAIYAVRYNLKTVVVSSDFGGQILETGDIENWPGTKHITGPELSRSFEEHARDLGAKLLPAFVKGINIQDVVASEHSERSNPVEFLVETDSPKEPLIKARSVILTSGAKHRKLGIPGENELAGRGVSYCATCDGAFFKNKVVAIVGGGDAAVTGAVDLTSNASKVYLIHRRSEFRAKPAYVEQARANSSIELILDTIITDIKGEDRLEYIVLDKPYKGSKELKIDGLFVEIGFLPETQLVGDLGVLLDEQGYIKVEKDQSTNIQGLFAAGDVTNASNRFAQLVTAASEGAIAAEAAFRYIKSNP